ncbi:non-ribosomal peptide synthetase [Dolichospermum compactum]|uniref:Amino acid adenylation domain-containing protein n=1 Tax=Dolichospermum compactum NIES-806 TaxID=1973481 RepID=A0A1Z4V7H3_9CYAN|nr:non-ribosomal peptide synthetase [Dolichospermum compactum]BAZ87501.1 amino acid adenylation domain-containing protein [Dolichospermum compactum NIES-806]
MTITQNQQIVSLMLRLQNMGCRIWAEDDKLRIRTSKNALTAELKQEIQNHKAEILTFLKAAKTQAVITAEIPALSADSPKLPSFAQQRLWLLAQLQGSSATYNMPIALQLNGNLNIDALHSSLASLLNRHESLRMYFPTVAGQPQVAIRSLDEIAVLTVQDCRELGTGNKGELDLDTQCPNIQDLIDAHAQEHLDLNTGPLFKAKLLQLEEQKSVLAINMHHIISDGWSMGVFLRELWQAYTAYSQGQTPTFARLPIQYSDYATWQRHWLQGEVLEKQINYWKHQLGDASPLLELPTDYPRPAQQSYRGDRYIYSLTPELTAAVNAFSQQQGVSLYMTLLATLSILLSRYSRQEDLCIGSPIANRTHSQTQGLIGFFVNTLVMRQQIKLDLSFIEFLQQTRQTCLDAYAHQDVPFDVLVEKLRPERSMSYNPLFQVMFTLENNASPDLDLSGLDTELLGVKGAIAKFDLTLMVMEDDHQLNCSWEYATDLFEEGTIQRMAEHFEVLLQGIIDHPQKPIHTLPLITAAELQQLQRWNQTQTDYFQDKTFVDLFAEQVINNPHNIAVVFESENLTYQQLNEKANQLANYLIENYKVQPDTLIGISVERSLEMIIGVLGIMKAGGAYVPIDINYPQERIKFMLEDSGISVLLTQSFVVDKLPLDSLENPIEVVYVDEELNKYPSPIVNCQLSAVNYNNLAYVIYTSGSTGKPKGVMIEHGGLVNLILAVDEILQIQPQSRVLQFANFSFDASIWEIASTLSAGACLYLTKKENLLPSQELIDFLTEYKITHVTLPPSVLSLLPHATLPDLQILITGGEVCPKELVTRWAKERSFFNGYGPTESTICTSIALCQPNGKKPLIGKPLPNLRIYILDAHNQPLPPGIPGELCIAGVGLARGYLNRLELTAEKFIKVELFGKVEQIYKTGDLVKWKDDGNLEYLGRIDEQVKLRGFRIEMGEIESLLLQHPLVKEAVVILYQTESNQSLIAYVTGIDPDFGSDLKKYLKSSLPNYMIPAQIVVLQQLPLTPNGKIDKKALHTPNVGIAGLHTAPRNKVEVQLAQLWSNVLERQEIGIHDNFFDLGGHSLLVIKLLNLMQEMFGQKLTLSSLFQNPTIAQLAEQLGNKEVQKSHPDVLLFQHQGNANPLFVVPGANGHGFYFKDLAINLENHPVYSLETPGRNGIGKVPKSVELHGSQLIDLLRQQQPQGPYILAGYSSGCAVAFEMAYQLEKQGEKLELLAILDAGLVTHPEYLIKRKDLDWIWQLLQRIEAVKGVSLGLEYAYLADQIDDQARWDLAAEFLYKKNVLPEHSSIDLLKTNMQVMKQLTINYANYRTSDQISAPIVLFRAQEVYDIVLQEIRAISNYDLPDWGWQAYTPNPIKVISVPGNHGGMLYEPNVKTLASHLRLMMG